jgi:hypothetical protein
MQSTGLSFGALDVATTPFAGAGALTVGNTIDGYTYLGVAGSGSALDGTSLKGMDI